MKRDDKDIAKLYVYVRENLRPVRLPAVNGPSFMHHDMHSSKTRMEGFEEGFYFKITCLLPLGIP